MKRIYTAPNADAAWAAFEEFEEKWAKPYPAIAFVPGMKGHESRRVLLVPGLGRAYGATVRNKGSWGNRMGRPLLLDGLRARVSSWPPLRLVRLRRERESVGVVSVQRFLAPLVEGE